MKIYLGADHAGFKLKNKIKNYLNAGRYTFEDLGNEVEDPNDDYPDFAKKVAETVSKDPSAKGILVCGSGVGVCIAANKIKGIRSINAYNPDIAQKSREHNDTNILCLGQNYIDIENAKGIIDIWLKTDFSDEERHKKRIAKINNL